MKQKFLHIEGGQVCYYEANENAPQTLFFLHGNSGSSTTWRKQVNDPSLSNFRLVVFDLLGHGHSSKSVKPEEDYTPIGTAKIMAGVIKNLANGSPFILVGFSYATNLVAEMMNFNVSPLGIVLISLCCLGQNFGPDKVFKLSDTPSLFFYNETDLNTVENFMASYVKEPGDATLLTDDYFRTDPQFRPVLMKAASEGKISDEILALQESATPLCIINGALDQMFYPGYIIESNLCFWKGNITVLEDAGHFVVLDQPTEVNKLISTYAKDVFTPARVS
jgi:pimeloyl-ACP methyl ester carboxylesterase